MLQKNASAFKLLFPYNMMFLVVYRGIYSGTNLKIVIYHDTQILNENKHKLLCFKDILGGIPWYKHKTVTYSSIQMFAVSNYTNLS